MKGHDLEIVVRLDKDQVYHTMRHFHFTKVTQTY